MSSSTLKKLHKKKRKKGNKLYILPVVVFTVLMLLVGTINYNQFNGNNPKNLITANDLKSLINQSTSSSKSSAVALDGSILKECYAKLNASYGADNAWEDIILQGAEAMKKNNFQKKLAAFEVGAHRAAQSLTAAKQKFHTYTVEPSPNSFKRIVKKIYAEVKQDPSLGAYIHLFNAAAGSESGIMVDFKGSGGTGDHIGDVDVWNMKPGKEEGIPDHKMGKLIQIPSVKLDDIIFGKVKPTEVKGLESGINPPNIDDYWALKVDTQGFEPQVFAGLKESIKQQKFKYIMTEYWPNGIGLLNNSEENKCEVAVEMMSTIAAAGYKIYAFPLVGHPHGTKDLRVKNALNDWKARPLHDLAADCQFMLDIESQFPNPEYHMGYWTDYLAVAPGADLVQPKSFKIN